MDEQTSVKKPLWKKWWFWGIVIVLIIALASGGEEPTAPVNKTADSEQTEVKNPPKKSAEVTIEQQRAAFAEWNTSWESQLHIFDGAWEIWKTTFDGMSKGTVDQYTAYSNLSGLEKQLGKIQGEYYGMDVPSKLTKEHQDLLKDAALAMGTATYCRREGVKKMMKFMDDPKPSLMEEAKGEISQGDAQMISALANVLQVDMAINPKK